MSHSTLPRDMLGWPIQAMAPGTTAVVAIGAASANVALPANAEVVRLAGNNNCHINFGTSGVTATTSSMLFPTGAEIFKVPAGATHVACIQSGAVTGSVTITKMD